MHTTDCSVCAMKGTVMGVNAPISFLPLSLSQRNLLSIADVFPIPLALTPLQNNSFTFGDLGRFKITTCGIVSNVKFHHVGVWIGEKVQELVYLLYLLYSQKRMHNFCYLCLGRREITIKYLPQWEIYMRIRHFLCKNTEFFHL